MATASAEYQLDELRIDTAVPLGEGGAATIHRCKTRTGRQMVLKRYHEEAARDLDDAALRHAIAWPASLGIEDRKQLMASCAWPQAVVVENNSLIGVLIKEAPSRFFYSRGTQKEPRHFNLVAVREEQAKKRGYPYYDFPHKIARLGNLLGALRLFHSNGIVVGDLQANNILTTGPNANRMSESVAESYWLDCDSFIVDGRAAFPPMDPLSTRPPYQTDGFTAGTDMYKFALLVIRCLSEHLGADTIDYKKFNHVLPSADFARLEKLLTERHPNLTSADLRGMAHSWQSVVRPDGKLYCRTDAALRERWTEAKRQLHFAGIAPPAPKPTHRRDAPPARLVKPAVTTTARPTPKAKATLKTTTSSKQTSKRNVPQPAASSSSTLPSWLIVTLAAFLVTLVALITSQVLAHYLS